MQKRYGFGWRPGTKLVKVACGVSRQSVRGPEASEESLPACWAAEIARGLVPRKKGVPPLFLLWIACSADLRLWFGFC